MASLPALPISRSLLERYRILSRRWRRPGMTGGHLMRRKGQSLEFREMTPYTLGDDIRRVDWRASARYGGESDLLARDFMAEEGMTIAISIDTRATMKLPEAMPKSRVAAWLAEGIATITVGSDDRVILHRLFGRSAGSLEKIKGSGGYTRILSCLKRFEEREAPGKGEAPRWRLNLDVLRPELPPASVWIIITDLYFHWDERIAGLVRAVAEAREGLRWVILVELDSWPHEKIILGQGGRRIEGPGLEMENPLFHIDDESVRRVEAAMAAQKRRFGEHIHKAGPDSVTWSWPGTPTPDPAAFFKDKFLNTRVFQRLFMRDAW